MSDEAVITLERIDLEVTKSVSTTSPLRGDIVTWTVDVTNSAASATAAASGVIVRDAVPAGQTVVPGSAVFPGGGTFNEVTGTWDVGQLILPGDTVRLTFQTVAGNSAEFSSAFADVEVSGTLSGTIATEGESFSYAITVTNNSEGATANATGLIVSNLLPAGLTYVTHAAASGILIREQASGIFRLHHWPPDSP